MTSEDQNLLEILSENEKLLISRKNPENLSRLLSPTFFEHGCSGKVWQREDTVKAMSAPSNANINAMDFKLHHLAKDIVLLTFKTIRIDDIKKVPVLRSSIWKKTEGNWQMMFHQGTLAP